MKHSVLIAALLAALVTQPSWAQEAEEETGVSESTELKSAFFRLRARLDVPLISAELMNNNHGTSVLLGGSIGIDLFDFVVIELGGAWHDAEDTAGDLFLRGGVFWEVYNSRTPGTESAGWQQGFVTLLGYRFLHDADALGSASGSSETHNITASAGWRSTYFWSEAIGLELRVLPTLSIPLDETQEGSWGQAVTEDGGDPSALPANQSPFARTYSIGNTDDMSYGLDFEITVGVVF